MQMNLTDFFCDNAESGFRLHKLEILNWGTFNKNIWNIAPEGHNALITGDIGSGKSTLVDAITSLLVQHNKIVYNKAAGAEGKERSLYSYIRGEYKSEKDDSNFSAKSVYLRDENSYSVILAVFFNKAFGHYVTIAQVFWLKDNKKNPERLFLVANENLNIENNFSDFGSDMSNLKKILKADEKIHIFTSFKDYSTRYRQLLGIANEKAMDLFYQTVSMKSVGNLTDFVRNHMLEKFEVENMLDELRRNYENLNRLHESVVNARKQIEYLNPIVLESEKYYILKNDEDEFSRCRDGISSYFASHKAVLLNDKIENIQIELKKATNNKNRINEEVEALREDESNLRYDIDKSGGRRIRELEQEIGRSSLEREKRQTEYNRYSLLINKFEFENVLDESEFFKHRNSVELLKIKNEEKIAEIREIYYSKKTDFTLKREECSLLENELGSLKKRKTNLPDQILKLRSKLSQILKIEESEIPFAGELIRVKKENKEWEGVIERLLYGFGQSLLVAEKHYSKVAKYVDETDLRGKIVYFRIKDDDVVTSKNIEDDSLVNKIDVRSDSFFYDWLSNQLSERFNYKCSETFEDFKRARYAVTINGQIKSGKVKHEKDDRFKLFDRKRFILGWDNKEKIEIIEREFSLQSEMVSSLAVQISKIENSIIEFEEKRDSLRDILSFVEYDNINWRELSEKIELLIDEKKELENSSEQLEILNKQLENVKTKILEGNAKRDTLMNLIGRLEKDDEERRFDLKFTEGDMNQLTKGEMDELYPKILSYFENVLSDKKLSLHNISKSQTLVREFVQNKIKYSREKLSKSGQLIIAKMSVYKNLWQSETREIDSSIESIGEFQKLLHNLIQEDLPRHEERFKDELNKGTIHSIAIFQSKLDEERRKISEKISMINQSLCDIEYNSGTYIELIADRTLDKEIHEFQGDLKSCIGDTIGGESYNESKFEQVKKLIEKFNGRKEFVDLDRRWTKKVTDVRNWFSFSASEKWEEDGTEKEFYSDSSGKSGGQKEKLAYTVLASALAYQFGLKAGETTSKSFRFVVIDEAFGRGSDESTRYGLRLFKKLDLQLLIVTPLQKIHVIENYINNVHFVHNGSGHNSQVRNLSIETYKDEKKERLD